MEENSGKTKGIEEENPFDEEGECKLSRDELMKMTAKELAPLAKPKSSLTIKTLERRPKPFLCDIILDIHKEEDKPKARASQSTSESEDMISFALQTLEAMKQNRENQEATLHPIAKELFKSSAVNKVDEARADGSINTDKMNTAIFALSGTALVIDGLIGFDNVPKLFNKMKTKFKKDDTK